jgi:hypothetical protein
MFVIVLNKVFKIGIKIMVIGADDPVLIHCDQAKHLKY